MSGFTHQCFPNHLRCSNVNASGRLICQDKLCTAGKLSGYDYLLDISSGEHSHRLASVITGNLKFLNQSINCLIDFLCIQEYTKFSELFCINPICHNIFPDGQIRRTAIDHTIFGNIGKAHFPNLPNTFSIGLLSANRYGTAKGMNHARN